MGCRAKLRKVADCLLVALLWLACSAPVRAELGGADELNRLQEQFRVLADTLSPSVVSISVAATASDSDDALRSESMNGERLELALSKTTRTVGTGFVLDRDGYILTNEHVIADAAQIWVTSDSGTVWPAVVIGSDPRADVAVLKVPVTDLKPVTFAAPGSVKRGSWTIALGNPIGLAGAGSMSMSVGIVSATDRSLTKLNSQEQRLYTGLIQTTAEINLGNSGGPLFNIDGKVIGISTAVILPQKGTNGIGFAVPVNDELMAKVRDLREGREIVYGYLGARVSTPTVRQRRAAGAPDGVGVTIEDVEVDSPGHGLLCPGDIVLAIDDHAVTHSDEFVRVVGSSSVVRPTKYSVRRDGETINVAVQLRQRQLPSVAVNRASQRIRWRGMLLGPIPANWKGEDPARAGQGLLVIGINSDARDQGVRVGAIISSVAGKAVSSVTELQAIINDTAPELCRIEFAPQPRDAVAGAQ